MILPIKNLSILLVSAVVSVEGWCFLASATFSQNSSDSVEMREAILDYTQGVYTVDILRIYKSVHPDLEKKSAKIE